MAYRNQLVYTVATSRRGHCCLRRVLNSLGVVCYYTFSVKGLSGRITPSSPQQPFDAGAGRGKKIYGQLTPGRRLNSDDLLADGRDTAGKIRRFMRKPPPSVPRHGPQRAGAFRPSARAHIVPAEWACSRGQAPAAFRPRPDASPGPIIDGMGEIFIVENKSAVPPTCASWTHGRGPGITPRSGPTYGETEPRSGFMSTRFQFATTNRVRATWS